MGKLNKGIKQIDEGDFIFEDEKERLDYYLDREPFFQYCKDNMETLSPQLKNGLISNLIPLGIGGEEYLKKITSDLPNNEAEDLCKEFRERLKSNPNEVVPFKYDTLVQIGYMGDIKQGYPIAIALRERKKVMMKNRGLEINEKGKLVINANTFSTYLLTRLNLLQCINGIIYIYKKEGYYVEITENFLKKVCRNILQEVENNIWKRNWENEYFDALKREMEFVSEFNPNKEVINFKNKMLNIYTMAETSHDPEHYSTIQIPIEYDKNATCPIFKSFLLDVFENDVERIKLIQEIMGYCFVPEIKIQKSFIFFGSGSNGKSVLAEVLRQLLGSENTSNVPLSGLDGRFGMQNLPGKLINISSENEFSKKFNTQTFKMISGGDAVNVEQKYTDSFNTLLSVKLIVVVNRLMDTDDYSEAYYRRLQIIPFKKTYVEKKVGEVEQEGISYMDKNLHEKILGELSGIVNFAMEGLQRLIRNNFNLTNSRVCEEALENYRKRQNPMIEFFNDRINVNPHASTKRSNYKKEFVKWAFDNGFEDFSNIGSTKFWDMFNKILLDKKINLKEKKIRGDIYTEGLEIFYEQEEIYSDYVTPSVKMYS